MTKQHQRSNPLTHQERRSFLKKAGLAAAFPFLPSCKASRMKWSQKAYRKPKESQVAVLRAPSYESGLTELMTQGIQACGLNVSGKRVLLKPNLVEYESESVINTHPAVVGAAIEAFRQLGAQQVTVGEGPGHRRDLDGLLLRTGVYPYLRATHTTFVDLNLDDIRKVPLLSNFMGISSLYFPATVLQSDLLVSMPKIKTHHWAGMTLSMKNLFGIVPGVKYGWPKNLLHWRGIHQSIVDINSTVPVDFVIADGVVGMEGNGPIQGKPKPLGVLVLGSDPVAVDATCARVAGIKPELIPYLQVASEFLGNLAAEQVRQVGEPIASVRQPFQVIESHRYLESASGG